MPYWLVATHLKSPSKSRLELSRESVVVGRVASDSQGPKLAIDFDPLLSRNHCEIRLDEGRARVRALENKHPIYVHGQPQQEFWLEPGEHFSSGQTSFEFVQMDPSLGLPTRSNTVMVDLSRLREVDSERCLGALLDLQPLLASGKDAAAMLAEALPILSKIVPMASGLLAISKQGEEFVTVARLADDSSLAPSRTLLREAVSSEESVSYFWDREEGPGQATVVAHVQWAVAAPIQAGGAGVFVLYAVGSENRYSHGSSGRTPGDLDRAVLTFLAGVLAQHFRGRWAAQQIEEERRQRYLAQSLREILAALTSTLEPARIIDFLLEHLQKLVGFDSAQHFDGDREPEDSKPRNGLALPLQIREQQVGLLLLTRHHGFFRPEEESLAVSLCAQAAVALDNARMFQTVERLAMLDELTQISNRRHFFRQAEALRGQAGPLSVVLLDIDHFKSFNDTYGHQTGDRVLTEVAQRVQRVLPTDCCVGRYGGEEFAAAGPLGLVAMAELAEAVRVAVAASKLDGVQLTVSLGVACCPRGDTTVQALLGAADEALYQAKREGRNRVCLAGGGTAGP